MQINNKERYMEVKLRGLDRYEVEAIQYDGTNSDEICQFILEHKP